MAEDTIGEASTLTIIGGIQMEHPSLTMQKAALSYAMRERGSLEIIPGSKIQLLYLAPGQSIIEPDVVQRCSETVGGNGSSELARISPTLVVKHGQNVNPIEARSMLFVADKTSIPLPKIHSVYIHGPLERDPRDNLPYDVYIFMEFVEGDTLDAQWPQYDVETKTQIAAELKDFMTQLHSIPGGTYVGSVDHGPMTDVLLEFTWPTRGPFSSEEEFNQTLAEAYEKHSKIETGLFILGMLNCHRHDIVFSHGDLRPANIIVKDGHVAAIVDWGQAGWYPEYWDFAKAFYIHTFLTDWGSHLLGILKPFYCEQAMHSRLSTKLW